MTELAHDQVVLGSGSGCSTAVKCTHFNKEVAGSNPTWCCFFSLLYPLSCLPLIHVPQEGATLLIFLEDKLSCAA